VYALLGMDTRWGGTSYDARPIYFISTLRAGGETWLFCIIPAKAEALFSL
jgi:hypothetical protein